MEPDINMIVREVRYTYQCCEQIFGFVPTISIEEVIGDFTNLATLTRPLCRGEAGVVTLLKPKTAALLGDRVWLQYPGEDPKLDFAFGWQSPVAIRLGALLAFMRSDAPGAPLNRQSDDISDDNLSPRAVEFLSFTEGDLAADYSRLVGASVTPLYDSAARRDIDYKPGSVAVIVSVVESVGIVTEETLSWDQVIQFRQDAKARAAYRRFVHWLNSEMVGKPASFVIDEVNARIEAYRWALRKHGLQTALGALERTLDAKSVFGGAAAALTIDSLAHQPLMSILAGAGLLVGKAAVHVATQLIERKDIAIGNSEVAFVHEVKTRVGR